MKLRYQKKQRGNILLFAMVFGAISFAVVVTGIAGYGITEHRASVRVYNREMAFHVAEAGIGYYRWHLAHNKNDYTDGTGKTGPYAHDFTDKNGTVIGKFSLDITPPPSGSSIVIVKSTGWMLAQPTAQRTIMARIGFPALTDYAFLTNSDVWIGDTETTNCKFHANGGIRYDGAGNAPITSAVATYTCKPEHGCSNLTKPGVWGAGGPPTYWQFPVPAKDFTAITANLAAIKTGAQSGGLYLTSSGKEGWRLEFTTTGYVKAYKVTATTCYKGQDIGGTQQVYCLDIRTMGTPTTYPMPANGYIYVEDTVWVDGVAKGRATVGTAAGKSIVLNGNLTYAAKDGTSVVGLIGEQNILIPHDAPTVLEVDAALLAQKGGVKRYYYASNIKNSLTIYGSVISYGSWTWSWSGAGGAVISGYVNTNATYDINLTYGPPPGFPVGAEYNLISWEEVKQ